MKIADSFLDLLISRIKIKYNGCHSPHPSEPFYGRAAYWYVSDHEGVYCCKITTPVTIMVPTPEELKVLFKAELQKRIGAIGEICEIDDFGRVQITAIDPYSCRRLLRAIEGKYYDFMLQGRQ